MAHMMQIGFGRQGDSAGAEKKTSGRGWRFTGLLALGAAVMLGASLHGPAGVSACGVFGCDRPGTPTNAQAVAGTNGDIMVSWVKTATEETCAEFQITENGQSADLGTGCVYDGGLSGPGQTVQRDFGSLQPAQTYCFQVRARDWNNGDPQDGYVSDLWSAQACAVASYPSLGAQTATAPQQPGAPTLEVASGQNSYLGVTRVTITWQGSIRSGEVSSKNGDWYVVERLDSGNWDTITGHLPNSGGTMTYTDTPPASALRLGHGYGYRVCAGNTAGLTCSTEVDTSTNIAPSVPPGVTLTGLS